MANITGKRFTTINASADEVYTVTLSAAGKAVDVVNNTAGDILISETNDFTQSVSGASYLTIPGGNSYNGLRTYTDTLYIKSTGSGTISMVLRLV